MQQDLLRTTEWLIYRPSLFTVLLFFLLSKKYLLGINERDPGQKILIKTLSKWGVKKKGMENGDMLACVCATSWFGK